jgi:hypothetical protein
MSGRRWEDNINEELTKRWWPNLAGSVMGFHEDYNETSGFIKRQRIFYEGERLSVSKVLCSRE